MLSGVWRQSYPTWFLIHVRTASGLPALSTDALLCRCKRRKKTFTTSVVLAHNGTASFDSSMRLKATLFSGTNDSKIRKKELKIELKAVDCCSPGNNKEMAHRHVHYESVIDLALFADALSAHDTVLRLTRTSTSLVDPDHIELVVAIYSSRSQSDLIGQQQEQRRRSVAPKLAINTFSSPHKPVRSLSSDVKSAGPLCRNVTDDEGDVRANNTNHDGENSARSSNMSVYGTREKGANKRIIPCLGVEVDRIPVLQILPATNCETSTMT